MTPPSSAVERTTGIVLAGGEGTRYGQPKAFLSFNGELLLERIVRTVSSVVDDVVVVGHPEPRSCGLSKAVSFIPDRLPHRGPLFALASAMEHCPAGLLVLVACDMPFISSGLLSYEVSLASAADAIFPVAEGRVQPLHSVYRTSIFPTVEGILAEGRTSIQSLPPRVRARIVDSTEWSPFSHDGRCFFGINTPEDHRFAEALA